MRNSEWLASARFTKAEDGVGGTIVPSDEFNELFRQIDKEIARVSQVVTLRDDVAPSEVILWFTIDSEKLLNEGLDASSTPKLVSMKHLPIPGTELEIGERKTLLSRNPERYGERLVREVVPFGTKFDTKAQLQALLTGLRAL